MRSVLSAALVVVILAVSIGSADAKFGDRFRSRKSSKPTTRSVQCKDGNCKLHGAGSNTGELKILNDTDAFTGKLTDEYYADYFASRAGKTVAVATPPVKLPATPGPMLAPPAPVERLTVVSKGVAKTSLLEDALWQIESLKADQIEIRKRQEETNSLIAAAIKGAKKALAKARVEDQRWRSEQATQLGYEIEDLQYAQEELRARQTELAGPVTYAGE